MFEKILVALDDSDICRQVYQRALEMAKVNHARLMLVHVLSPIDDGFSEYPIGVDVFYPRLHEEAIRHHIEYLSRMEEKQLVQLKALVDQGHQENVTVEFTQMMGDPGSRICALARTWDADLIILGRRGRQGLSEWLLGSVSNYVVHHAPCSVLTVQHIEPAPPAAAPAASEPIATV